MYVMFLQRTRRSIILVLTILDSIKLVLVWKIILIMMEFQLPLVRKQIGGGDVR